MEAVTAAVSGTGSKTMADLAATGRREARGQARAAPQGRRRVARRHLRRARRVVVSEVGRGLIDLGLEHGDKVSILSHTRPEWTYANLAILAAGTVSVSIYQTNSAEECHYVLEHSESKAVFVEDAEQLAKIREVQADLPAPRAHRDLRPVGRRRRRDLPRRAARARRGPRGRPSSRSARTRSPRTTSASPSTRQAPPARPRAASSATATTATSRTMTESMGVVRGGRRRRTSSSRSRTRSRS